MYLAGSCRDPGTMRGCIGATEDPLRNRSRSEMRAAIGEGKDAVLREPHGVDDLSEPHSAEASNVVAGHADGARCIEPI
jgi:hypothetical protein